MLSGYFNVPGVSIENFTSERSWFGLFYTVSEQATQC